MTDWQIIFTGKAIIKTPTQTIEITPDELEWETKDGDTPLVHHVAVYRFDGGEISWLLFGYMHWMIDAQGCHLLQNFSILPPRWGRR
jgi:hypothetical protein